MRTSEEIYHRIRWDGRFDASRFVLGIEVRAQQPKRLAFSAFVPGGDLPWHRVLFIEADGEIVWERSSGTDRLDESQVGRVRAPQLLRPPFFDPRRPFAWAPQQQAWTDTTATASNFTQGTISHLRVLSWNTLWDRYDADRIDTDRRRPLLLEALRQADADLIALQETERPLLAMLLQEDWVRAAYTVTDAPAGRDVEMGGMLILSRLPVLEVGWHQFGPHKAAVAVTVPLASGSLVVVNVHLSSDHSQNGATRRQTELAALGSALSGIEGDLVLLGDFNDGGGTPARVLGLRDAWNEVHGPADDTPTFDPTVNALAAISSLSGLPGRLDRVLLRGAALKPGQAELLGTVPQAGLYPSDHYGLQVDLKSGSGPAEGSDLAPTARTALAWLPPEELWPPIQELRQIHDPQIHRWPPHVNVVFGFVPESAFEVAAAGLSAAAAEVQPFTAALEGVRAFRHSSESTVWLDPAADGSADWTKLRQALERRFPRCKGREEGYTPHLTLGKAREPERLLDAWKLKLGRQEASVRRLVLLSRRGEEPLRIRARLELGSGKLSWVPPEPTVTADPESAGRRARVEVLVERLRATLPQGEVHVVGSRRMGCVLADGDLDLVAVLPAPLDLRVIEAAVRQAVPEAEAFRAVQAVRVPGLEWKVGGLEVDLSLVEVHGAVGDAVARRMELEASAAMALSAVSDAEALLKAVGDRVVPFQELGRVVKAWAKAKGLDSAPFGGLPGFGWLVLAAHCLQGTRHRSLQGLLQHFFETWAAWDWRKPVALNAEGEGVGLVEDPMRIATPTSPVRSCSDQVGSAGMAALTEELYAAWELVASGAPPLPALLAAPALHRRHAAWAVITVEAADPVALAVSKGWVRGKVRSLLTSLERAGVQDLRAWPRPFEQGPRLLRFAVGLGRHPLDAAALERIAAPWAAGLRGVSVAWAENGAVPTLN